MRVDRPLPDTRRQAHRRYIALSKPAVVHDYGKSIRRELIIPGPAQHIGDWSKPRCCVLALGRLGRHGCPKPRPTATIPHRPAYKAHLSAPHMIILTCFPPSLLALRLTKPRPAQPEGAHPSQTPKRLARITTQIEWVPSYVGLGVAEGPRPPLTSRRHSDLLAALTRKQTG